MTDHRHATDRTETVVVAGCPEGCQSFELESEGREESVETLVETVKEAFGECSQCGEPIGFLRKEEPSEVLE
ncbi:hypothetical protein [Natrinema versiforme]|uniref:Uncharacterized protein n=1 Tax=Natrinema versiforme JCM 10478 TaxID=1227496 RepID=L9Y5E1_9EURY|nr:hypothetical protein [Natrinema versiforme]ELY68876.1 hypothetical protein C489_05903 [Natrinema versiforme JCM 10478]